MTDSYIKIATYCSQTYEDVTGEKMRADIIKIASAETVHAKTIQERIVGSNTMLSSCPHVFNLNTPFQTFVSQILYCMFYNFPRQIVP